jgi:hypothetical protein
MADSDYEWFPVRCLYRSATNKAWGPHDLEPGEGAYEERITLWLAESTDHAIQLAEAEAAIYETQIEIEYLGLAQSYRIADPVEPGGEIFRWSEGVSCSQTTTSTTFSIPEANTRHLWTEGAPDHRVGAHWISISRRALPN